MGFDTPRGFVETDGSMCGIAGAIDQQPDRGRRRVTFLNQCQHHRGPDHAALVAVGAFTLGNTRLAIQDPTPAGNQPFRSADGRYVCVFNGELYNYRELRDEFRLDLPNQCDGAVIPELWRLLGPDCLRRFRGMYAIALVDTVSSTLSLARDPYGIKPLYIRRLPDGSLVFGSEVRPLASVDALPQVSREAVARYLHLGSMPSDSSPFEGIDAVAPNTVLMFDQDGQKRHSAIVPGGHPLIESDDDRLRASGSTVGSVLRESVELHLRADVPVVLLLSSGVDSTALASAARQQGHDLHCMTVAGVGDSDESGPAALAAKHYGHEHEVIRPSIDGAALREYFAAMQRPTIDGLNTFIICRAVRASGHKVALSGLGSDEALGGYSHYRLLPRLRLLDAADRVPWVTSGLCALGQRASPRLAKDKVRRLLLRGGPRTSWALDLLQREVHSPETVQELTGIDVGSLDEPPHDPSQSFESLVEAELANYMQATLLPDADGFSMCSSVELRVPFVDRDFFAAAVDANRGRRRPVGKRLLADALGDDFLLELCRRPKRGFSVPMVSWLADGPLKAAADSLDDDRAPVWDFVRRPSALARVSSAPVGRWSELWSLASLNQWLRSLTNPVTLTTK